MKVTYNGTEAREFPTLGITAQPGDTLEVPADFDSAFVSTGAAPKVVPTAPVVVDTPATTSSTTSAASDSTTSEVK